MKLTLRLILSLVSVVAVVAFLFSLRQARQEKDRLLSELEKKANVMADSLRISIEPLLTSDNPALLQRLIDKFSNREKIVGVDIHDIRNNLIASSNHLWARIQSSPDILSENIQEVERLGAEFGKMMISVSPNLFLYSVPLNTGEKVSHVLTLFYDVDYIEDRVKRLWTNGFLRVSTQAFFIAVISFVIILLNVMIPIKNTTEWLRRIRKRQPPIRLKASDQLLLGPLVIEIDHVVKSLEKARLAAEEEARLRYSSESRWTAQRLKEVVRLKLEERPLVVVSNREPYMHIRNGKEIECIVPASGLVTAMEPILNACGGLWVAQGSGNADRETVDKKDHISVPPQDPKYTLRRVWIEKELDEGFYSGFANEGLWPLCHIAHTRPIFRDKDWEAYQAVNQQFADCVLEEIASVSAPNILVQDYHFALLPQMIKAKRPDARVAIFWHIPWPNPESFGICPWYKELLKGMLGADLVGFHTQFHCNNFIESVDRFLESRIDYEHFTINREGHTTLIKPFPISIHFDSNGETKHASQTKEVMLRKYGLQAQWMGVGVDRLDYTKGILERFRAVEALMDKHSAFRGTFTFVELGAPSRTMIPKYKEFVDEIAREAERINNRFKTKNWQPILLLMKHHSHADIMPFYKAADVCMVTSLHDGMNLVAKEFISAKDDNTGVLILSQFTGAARELRDALIVNPYDIGQTSEAIRFALEMSKEEQAERMKRMRNIIQENNIYRWAGELVGQLAQVRLAGEEGAS